MVFIHRLRIKFTRPLLVKYFYGHFLKMFRKVMGIYRGHITSTRGSGHDEGQSTTRGQSIVKGVRATTKGSEPRREGQSTNERLRASTRGQSLDERLRASTRGSEHQRKAQSIDERLRASTRGSEHQRKAQSLDEGVRASTRCSEHRRKAQSTNEAQSINERLRASTKGSEHQQKAQSINKRLRAPTRGSEPRQGAQASTKGSEPRREGSEPQQGAQSLNATRRSITYKTFYKKKIVKTFFSTHLWYSNEIPNFPAPYNVIKDKLPCVGLSPPQSRIIISQPILRLPVMYFNVFLRDYCVIIA